MKAVNIVVIVIVCVILLLTGGIWTLAYLRTGQQYYDEKNLEACSHYSNEQAKEAVLYAWLKNGPAWNTWQEAQQVAFRQGVTFLDNEIQGPAAIWLVPFTVADKPGKKQFGMLDCGTLTVEFSAE